MDTLEHFTTRHITDSVESSPGTMEIMTDEENRFLINITENATGVGAGIYMDKDARKELIAILLKTL